jgi:ABC-2 type transport system ATP-binding protein
VVFLDEPMSGLDPIGRREVRDLIGGLRGRGCTVFFSSHILSDAEALCDRVAVVAQGKVAASGRLDELLAFELQGWELVVSAVAPALQQELTARFTRVTALPGGRVTVTLPPDTDAQRVIAELGGNGARLESLNPVRHTLEDLFLHHVRESAPRATGL